MARLIAGFLVLFSWSLLAPAGSPEDMTKIRARLDKHPQLRADYVQTRRMADVQRPLVARGRMLVWGRDGVIWEVERPFRAAYVLRHDQTIQIAADGRQTVRRAEDDAVSARVGRVLNAVVQGDTKTLEQWFDISVRMEGERWTIALTPRQGPMASFLKSMHISGGEFVEAVGLEEAGGDTTQIEFRNHRDAAPLSEEERRLLAAG
jgi:hypothetical protein